MTQLIDTLNIPGLRKTAPYKPHDPWPNQPDSLLFITGATGFIGGAVTAQALSEGRKLLILVRAENVEAALQRMVEKMRVFEVEERYIATLTLENILLGDMLDVEAFIHDPRLLNVTEVINCAANTSPREDPTIFKVNVDGVLALATAATKWPKLRRFVHVGTAFVCGMNAPRLVMENYDPAAKNIKRDLPTVYVKAKLQAEERMRAELPDLPLVIARPSVVMGHTRLGIKASPSIWWVFRMGKELGWFPDGFFNYKFELDLVPVDYVADALMALTYKPTLSHKIYHISAGLVSKDTFEEGDRIISAAMGVPMAKDVPPVTPEEMEQRFNDMFPEHVRRRAMAGVRYYAAYAELCYIFDNTNLLAEGIQPAPYMAECIAQCVRTTKELGTPIHVQMMYN